MVVLFASSLHQKLQAKEVEWNCISTQFPLYIEGRLANDGQSLLLRIDSKSYNVPQGWSASLSTNEQPFAIGERKLETKISDFNSTLSISSINLNPKLILQDMNIFTVSDVENCDEAKQVYSGKSLSFKNEAESSVKICGSGEHQFTPLVPNEDIAFGASVSGNWLPLIEVHITLEPWEYQWEEVDIAGGPSCD
jgi:hypothetical protein